MVNRTRVALTGFGGLDSPDPGIGVAEAIRHGWRGGLEIYALCYDVWSTGAWLPGLVDRLHVIPPLAKAAREMSSGILAIHEERPFDALIPNLDLEVNAFARIKPQLDKAGIATLLPPLESYLSTTKILLPRFCYSNFIFTPRTQHVPNIDEVPMQADQFGYPLVVKGSIAGAAKVHNSVQAHYEAVSLDAKWGGGVLLQEYIDGEEYVVAAVARADGSCLGMVSMRKQGINSRGKAMVGSVVNAPDVEKTAHEILEKLQWRGPLELEFIRSRANGRLYLFEINCRFPSWIMLSAFAGCNLPVALLREILEPGRRRPRAPEAGVSYIRHVHDFTVSMDDINRLERHGWANGRKAGARRSGRRRTTNGDTVVAVTGISAFEDVLSGCGVSKALARSGEVARLLGLVYGPFDTGAFQADTFDAIYRIPNGDDSEKLLSRLLQIKKRDGLDVIIPCIDFEIERFLNLRDELTRHGIHTILPTRKALHARAKKKLFSAKMRERRGVLKIPGASVLRKKSSLTEAIETHGFPLVIKGETAGMLIANNSDQAFAFVREMRDDGHEVLLAQAFVRGDEFAYSAVCGPDHRVIQDVLIKKLCQSDKGKTWGAINVIHADLVAALRDFLRSIAWTGPVEIEMIRDVRDDSFTLIEVNPRFPAWISYTCELGINLPLTALNSVLGRDAGHGAPNRDRVFMRSCQTLPVDSLDFATIATSGVLNHER